MKELQKDCIFSVKDNFFNDWDEDVCAFQNISLYILLQPLRYCFLTQCRDLVLGGAFCFWVPLITLICTLGFLNDDGFIDGML